MYAKYLTCVEMTTKQNLLRLLVMKNVLKCSSNKEAESVLFSTPTNCTTIMQFMFDVKIFIDVIPVLTTLRLFEWHIMVKQQSTILPPPAFAI